MQKGSSPIELIIGVIVIAAILGGVLYFSRLTSPKTNLNLVKIPKIPKFANPKASSTSPISIEKFTYLKEGDVFAFDLTTKQNTRLTNYEYNTSPILSPDNTMIAYLSIPENVSKTDKAYKGSGIFYPPYVLGESKDFRNVWIINIDGSIPVQVTKEAKNRRFLSWSKDSTKLSYEEDGQIIEYDIPNKKFMTLGGGTNPIYLPKDNGRAFLFGMDKTLQIFDDFGGRAFTHKQKISDLNPSDSNKIFFTSKEETDGPTFEWKFSIWVSPPDNESRQITKEEDMIHTPSVSPSERYIAASKGSGYADAGNMDLTLVILELDKDFKVSKQIMLENFKGPEFFEKEKKFMFPYGMPVWLNDKEVLVLLNELGVPDENTRGIYKLNVEKLSAELLLELQ